MDKESQDAPPTENKDLALANATEVLPKAHGAKPRRRLMAELGLSSIVPNVTTVRSYAKGTFGDMDLTQAVAVMTEKVAAVRAGDLGGVETTLLTQAVALDTIFNELARRAAANMNDSLPAAETFLRLGLKAQAQCRATLQTLAEIKNPQPLAFVKQANIAHGPQQVNNGVPAAQAATAQARAENFLDPSNELLGIGHDARLDAGTEAAASGTHTPLAAVDARHRSENGAR